MYYAVIVLAIVACTAFLIWSRKQQSGKPK